MLCSLRVDGDHVLRSPGKLEVMQPGGVFTIAETQTARITDKLHKTFRKREIVTKSTRQVAGEH